MVRSLPLSRGNSGNTSGDSDKGSDCPIPIHCFSSIRLSGSRGREKSGWDSGVRLTDVSEGARNISGTGVRTRSVTRYFSTVGRPSDAAESLVPSLIVYRLLVD